jgi:hypothetical protein
MLVTAQLSDTLGMPRLKLVILAVHCPGLVLTVTFAGQVMVGGCVSLMVTVNVQEAVAPEGSVAVHVTVVVPTGKNEPDAGLHETRRQSPEVVGDG